MYPPKSPEDLRNISGLLTFNRISEKMIAELMITDMVSRAFGFGMEISNKYLVGTNKLQVDKVYTDKEAITYFYGSTTKKSLAESSLIHYIYKCTLLHC